MRRKINYFLPILFSILFLSLVMVTINGSYSLPITDGTDDVTKLTYGTYDTTGDFADGIDIVSLGFSGTNLELTLQGTPVENDHYQYFIEIYWDGDDDSTNLTMVNFGSTEGYPQNNVISMILQDGSGNPVVGYAHEDEVYIDGNKIVAPIANYSLIQDPLNPETLSVMAVHEEDSGTNYYYDYYPEEDNPYYTYTETDTDTDTDTDTETDTDTDTGFSTSFSFPGFTIGITCLGTLVVTTVIILRYRKRR
jgi:hypothetical protein